MKTVTVCSIIFWLLVNEFLNLLYSIQMVSKKIQVKPISVYIKVMNVVGRKDYAENFARRLILQVKLGQIYIVKNM